MGTGVLPVLITVPFEGETAAADRKRFMKNLFLRIDCPPDEGCGFYGWLQYHAFEATPSVPPKGMQLYDILQSELNLFPHYIENQRNINDMLLTSNPIKDLERMAGLPPPLPYSATVETSDDYGELHWECYRGRLAIVADDAEIYEWKTSGNVDRETYPDEERYSKEVSMMTVVIVEVNEYDLTKEKKDQEWIDIPPDAGHTCAAKLFEQSPQWCKERGIQAMRIKANDVSATLACIEVGNVYFYEMAEQAESDMIGTRHDDSTVGLQDYSGTCFQR